MIYLLMLSLGVWASIPFLMVWYLILPKTYFLTFNGQIPSRLSIFTQHFLSFLALFMILGLGIELAFRQPEDSNAPFFFLISIFLTLIFCVYFGRNKINLGDKKRYENRHHLR